MKPNIDHSVHRARRGVASIVMVLIMLMLELVIIAMVLGGSREQTLTARRVETVQSFFAAEAGVNMGVREVVLNFDEDGDGVIGSISDDDDDDTDPTIGSARVQVSATSGAGTVLLHSKANAGLAQRSIQSTVQAGSGNSPGLRVERFYPAGSPNQLSDIDWDATPAQTAVVAWMNFAWTSDSNTAWPGGPTIRWGQRFTGKVIIPTTGTWTFYTNSDDGSRLIINCTMIVDNDFEHAMQERSGSVALAAGPHNIEVLWFVQQGSHGLIVSWAGPGVAKQVIPASAFVH